MNKYKNKYDKYVKKIKNIKNDIIQDEIIDNHNNEDEIKEIKEISILQAKQQAIQYEQNMKELEKELENFPDKNEVEFL
jgi:hypothetical protein